MPKEPSITPTVTIELPSGHKETITLQQAEGMVAHLTGLLSQSYKEIVVPMRGDGEIPMHIITEATAHTFHILHREMMSRDKRDTVAFPRMVAMYLCRTLTRHTLEEIAAFFMRDHAAVSHACNAVRDRMRTDGKMDGKIVNLTTNLEKLKLAA